MLEPKVIMFLDFASRTFQQKWNETLNLNFAITFAPLEFKSTKATNFNEFFHPQGMNIQETNYLARGF